MVTGHNNLPLLILSVMSPFQTVLLRIFFFGITTMTKLMDTFLQNLRYEEQIENSNIHGMRFPTMWYVRPAKAHTSLCIRAV